MSSYLHDDINIENLKHVEVYMNFRQYIKENSTDDAKKTLEAIIGFLEKAEDLDADGKDMLKMGKGMMDFFDENKSFSPGQAKWIFNTSKALFK